MDESVINEREQEHARELTEKKEPIREWWYRDSALVSFLFNTSSATVPEGERFIVRAAEDAKKMVLDQVLIAHADTLIHEETAHARMHDAYNRYLDSQGFFATKKSADMKALLTFFEKRFSLHERLVTCTIIEHFTVLFSKQILDQGILEGEDVDERMDRVWSWHCIEEMEHRSTAMDLYRAMDGKYFTRLYIGIFVSVMFAFVHTQNLIGFLRAKKLLWKAETWKHTWKYIFGTKGIYRLIVIHWLQYFVPGYHPNQIPILNRYNKQLHHYHIEDELVGYFK